MDPLPYDLPLSLPPPSPTSFALFILQLNSVYFLLPPKFQRSGDVCIPTTCQHCSNCQEGELESLADVQGTSWGFHSQSRMGFGNSWHPGSSRQEMQLLPLFSHLPPLGRGGGGFTFGEQCSSFSIPGATSSSSVLSPLSPITFSNKHACQQGVSVKISVVKQYQRGEIVTVDI